ncbi:MAG: ATP-binding protein [Phycisphaerae bacterium]
MISSHRKRTGRFFWKLFLGNALLLGLVLGACVWLIVQVFERFHAEELGRNLRTQALALVPAVADRFSPVHRGQLQALIDKVGGNASEGVRITLVSADGTVLADSQADPGRMESHADRAEVRQALAEGWGESTRWSKTVSRELKYVAVRVGPKSNPVGVLRVAMAVRSIGARTQAERRLIWTIALLALLAAISLALGLARIWSGRIAHLTAAARSLSQGDLSARIAISGRDEVALLARSLNKMRKHLAGQLRTIDEQRLVLEAMLKQLHEGVIVADHAGRIVVTNPAADHLLGLTSGASADDGGASSLTVQKDIHQPALARMLEPPANGAYQGPDFDARDAATFSIEESRLDLPGPGGSVSVLARATDILLPVAAGRAATDAQDGARERGRLLVLTDITELTRTIQMKTDFVANASHELRTPVSAIRAAVETLTDSDTLQDPTAVQRFLGVIDRHSTRLEEMVHSALDLSRIESASARFEPTSVSLQQVCAELHERRRDALEAKQLHWDCQLDPRCERIMVNPHLLSLALGNLLDNALRFTDVGGRVSIRAEHVREAVSITVADDGCGIAPQEHQRVFERFYQVSASRSGVAGSQDRGTGLGLSIVRHAVAAMRGTVELQSAPGRGTEVTVSLPKSALLDLDTMHA